MYKTLQIYELAHQYVLTIYKLTNNFPQHEDKNLTSQLRRAATSLPLNIAEGSGARYHKINLNYLTFCYRSTQEIEATLRLAKDLNYITEQQHKTNHEQLELFIKKLYNYMKYIEKLCDKKTQYQNKVNTTTK